MNLWKISNQSQGKYKIAQDCTVRSNRSNNLVEEEHAVVLSLQGQVGGLTQPLSFYKASWEWFICVYKYNNYKNEIYVNHWIIDQGNNVVQCGDTITDTFIYNTIGKWVNITVFKKLYGFDFDPLVIRRINK